MHKVTFAIDEFVLTDAQLILVVGKNMTIAIAEWRRSIVTFEIEIHDETSLIDSIRGWKPRQNLCFCSLAHNLG
jgi:hypothetical protein